MLAANVGLPSTPGWPTGSNLAHQRHYGGKRSVSGQIQYGRAEVPNSLQTLPATPPAPDDCHFVMPVRFGRRKSDQVGHLVMTTSWLKFRGTVDVSVLWTDVADIQHTESDVIISLHDGDRRLRFSCRDADEATRGAAIARHLTEIARAAPFQTV